MSTDFEVFSLLGPQILNGTYIQARLALLLQSGSGPHNSTIYDEFKTQSA